jgi:ribosomal subunit interface protein
VELTDSGRARIEEKVDKLPKYYDRINDIEVIVEGGQGPAAGSVEIVARAGHNHTFVAKHIEQDMFRCVDEAINKIESQIKKQKEKERDNRHPRTTTS